MDVIRGRAWKYGDNVNTDVIYPGKYTYTVSGREEIARHALEDLDSTFVTGMQPGDTVEVDITNCIVRCPAGEFSFPPFSPSIMHIIEAGGLIAYVKRSLEA